MKSAILMASLAVAALASPAFALPDRFDMGTGCSMSSVVCAEQDLTNDGGKPDSGAVGDSGSIGAISSGLNASTGTQTTSLGGTGGGSSASATSPSTKTGVDHAGSLHNL